MEHRKIRLIISSFSGAKGYFALAVFASLLTTVLNALTPQIFRFTIDSVLDGDGYPFLSSHLWVMAVVLMGCAALSGLSMFLSRYNTARAGETFAQNMRDMLFSHVQKVKMDWHDK